MQGREPAGTRVRIFDQAEQIAAADWDRLTTNPYQSRGWLLALEESLPDTRFLYFCAYEQGRLRAILTAYDRHVPTPPDTFTRLVPPAGPRATRLANVLLRHVPLSILVAGSPYSYVSDPIGDPAWDKHLVDALRTHAETNRVDVVSFLHARRPVDLEGAVSGPCIDDFELDLPGASPDDYCATFASRTRRYKCRREFRNARPCAVAPLAGHGKLLSEHGLASANRHGNATAVPPALYENLAHRLGDRSKVLLIEKDGEVGAIVAVLEGGDQLYAFHVGVRERDKTYFDIGFVHPIRRAYELGLSRINYRPAGEQAKTLRGCRRIPTRFHCLPVTRKARAIVRLVNAVARLSGAMSR